MLTPPSKRRLWPYNTLIEAIADAPLNKPFVTMWKSEDDVQTITFGNFISLAEAHAAHFKSHGLKADETVILIMPQGIPLMTAFVGAMLLSAIPAILAYPNFKVDSIKYRHGLSGVTENLQAKLVVVDKEFPREFIGHIAGGGHTKVIRTAGAMATPLLQNRGIEWAHVHPDNVAFIQHSSGTTGLQKGVALSHRSVLNQLHHLGESLNLSDQDQVYSWLPLYHDMGLIACFMLPMTFHLHVVMQSPTDWVMQPATMLQLISDYRCSLCWVPNFTFQFVSRRVPPENRLGYDLTSLRAIINCSETVRARSMDEFYAAYADCGLKKEALQSSYAMAENVFAVTQSRINDKDGPQRIWVDGSVLREKHIAIITGEDTKGAIPFVSSGTCLPTNQVRIVSPSGEDLPDGYIGEILIQSDSLFAGYYNRPDLTTKALVDGYYRSGDLGFRIGAELYVIGRKNDLVIIGGKNIYPQDVEEIACRHPSIHDGRAVAFGLFNPELGTEDIIVVVEVIKIEDIDRPSDIERAIRSEIIAELGVAPRAVYLKPPKWIVKSTAGKTARSSNREKLLSEHPELSYGRQEW